MLEGGSWLYDGRFTILQRWHHDIGLDHILFAKITMLYRILTLVVHLWGKPAIDTILSVVGTPLFMDEATCKGAMIDFDCGCVKISADHPLASLF